jgi:hypothetical protein
VSVSYSSGRMKPLLRKLSLPLRRGVALVLLLAVLMVVAMAAAPRLHEAAHHDADRAGHECAVTLFASGALHDAVPVLAVAPELVLVPDEAVVERQRIVSSFRFSGILEHAPPRRS